MSEQSNQSDNHRKTVGEWLGRSFVWRIPVYQRHYAWNAEDTAGPIHLFWETVEEQTDERLKGNSPANHYLGAVLVENKTRQDATDGITRYDVVDGQQRLTTIQVALLALIQVADEAGLNIKPELDNVVFSNKAANQTRLVPTNFDNKQFQSVLFDVYGIMMTFGSEVPKENAIKSKIVSSFHFFQEKFRLLVNQWPHKDEDIIRALMDSLLHGFDLVRIVLRKTDEAQRIFESLNNFSLPLTTFDLIRNNLFYRATFVDPDKDVELFGTRHWQQLEKPYWGEKADNRKDGASHIEAYIARMLVAGMKKDIRFNRNEIFKTYKEFGKKCPSIEEELQSLVEYVKVYRFLDSNTDSNPVGVNVDFGIFRHNVWKNRDFYPVIFCIVSSAASVEEKQRMLKLLESYVIRRGVCGLSPSHYNKYAAHICGALGDDPNYEALRKVLASAARDSTVFPDNKRVEEGCISKKFYGSAFQWYVFGKIEASLHSTRVERVIVEEGSLTIDHILPQGWGNNPTWTNIVLGPNHRQGDALAVDPYLDTIGNLTLMSDGNNSVKSNHPFDEVKGLLAVSELKLNRELAEEDVWNVEKITARSKYLAGKICEIWPYLEC
ncbi:MAG: DUF262 domain-containing protein [Gammaproteobacteria bacterium]